MKVFLFILLPAVLLASQSAVKLAINETTVQEILSLAESLGGKNLAVIPFNNYTYNLSKTVYVQIYNLSATNAISFKYPNIFFVAPNLVQINLTNFQSFVKFNYTEVIVLEKIHGYGNITAPSVNISIVATFSEFQGSLQVNFQSVVVQIANVTVNTTLKSGLNIELQNAINSDLPNITKDIEAAIYAEASKIDLILAGLPKYLPFPPLGLMFDISMANDTLVEGTYMSLSFKGEILTYPFRTAVGVFNPQPLPQLQPGYPWQAQFSDYIIETLLNSQYVNLNLTLGEFPPGIPLKLTTDGLGFLIPNLKKTYGSGKNVTINVMPSANQPYLTLTSSNGLFNIGAWITLKFYVVVSPTNISHAVDLDIPFDIFIGFNIINFIMNVDIDHMTLLNITTPFTNVGAVNIPLLNKLLVALFKTVLPIINALIPKDINIPQPNIPVVFYESSVTVSEGCLLLQAGII